VIHYTTKGPRYGISPSIDGGGLVFDILRLDPVEMVCRGAHRDNVTKLWLELEEQAADDARPVGRDEASLAGRVVAVWRSIWYWLKR
jgi:hypothetical protein